MRDLISECVGVYMGGLDRSPSPELFHLAVSTLKELPNTAPNCSGLILKQLLQLLKYSYCPLIIVVLYIYVLGSLVPWFLGSLVPWFLGSLVPWFLGFSIPWFLGSLVPWFLSSLLPWFLASLVPCFLSSLVPWLLGSLVP